MRLGYGTAALGRSRSVRERRRLVEAAYDAGIRYFDTAPLYGAGAAEEALGRLRGEAVIATKAGIVAPSLVSLAAGKALGRPAAATGGRFAPHEVRAQLEGSLRRLRRDRVDVLLLHEVETAHVDPLLETLESMRAEGKVGLWGVATRAAATAAILAKHRPDVVQVAAAEALDPAGARLVLHSVLVGRLGDRSAAELLREAAHAHPGATILVGSCHEGHIREAAAALS
ncbi:MAG: aldo/keto reductase [Gaiellaceae bacterium]